MRWLFLAGLAILSGACRSGISQCEAIEIGTPVAELDTEQISSTGTPHALKGPVAAVVYCFQCLSSALSTCSGDCQAPLYTQGKLLALPGTMETFEGYPQLSSEYAICEIWAFQGRVEAVWWAPMY